MNAKRLWLTLSATLALCFVLSPSATHGQVRGYRSVADQIRNRPTVSPYLNLALNGAFSGGNGGFVPTYQSIVRPQLEQRQQNDIQARQLGQLQQQVANLRLDTQSQNGAFATGHQSRFGVHLHFYPQLNQGP